MTAVDGVFPPAFVDLLAEVVARAPRLRGGEDPRPRARRRRRASGGLFAGHRRYVLGDDLRLLDWNVYARTGELFLKVLEDEDRRALTLLVDTSASMAAGDRFTGTLRLAALLGALALAHLDGVHVVAAGRGVRLFEGPASRPRLLEHLAGLAPEGPDDPAGALGALERTAGRVCWLSDFADPGELAPALASLRRRGRRCVGWLPVVDEDREPAASGWIRLHDPESGAERVVQVDGALRRAMKDELVRLARQQDAVFSRAGVPLVRFPLPADDDFAPASWMEVPWSSRL